jgi:Sugar (and other) transporter
MPSSLSPSPSRNSRRRESSSSSSPTRKIGGASLGDGYKTWLQRAIRVEEESDPEIGDNLGGGGGGGGVDWTPHTIDYALFKSRLKFFAHRRAQLRYLLRESGDQRLSKTVLDAIVEPQPKRIDFRDTNADTTAAVATAGGLGGSAAGDVGGGPAASVATAVADAFTTTPAGPPVPDARTSSEPIQAKRSSSTRSSRSLHRQPPHQPHHHHQQQQPQPQPQHQAPPVSTQYHPMDAVVVIQGSASFSDGEESVTQTAAINNNVNSHHFSAFPFMGQRRVSKRTIWRRVSNAERQEMVRLLTWELEKAALFYLVQWQKLSRHVLSDPVAYGIGGGGGGTDSLATASANSAGAGLPASIMSPPHHPAAIGVVAADPSLDSDAVGDEILELIAFCVINVVTVRQILIRYDAFSRTFGGTPLMNYYFKHALKHPTSYRKLLYHEELSAIADVYEATLATTSAMGAAGTPVSSIAFQSPVAAAAAAAAAASTTSDLPTVPVYSSDDTPLSSFIMQRKLFRDVLTSSESAASVASTGHERLTDSFIHTVRHSFLLGAFEDRLGFEPSYLTMRGQSLTKEISMLAEWRQHRERVDRHHKSQTKPPVPELSGMQVYHLTLNLISGFLYCMNYYIVEPSSTMYVNRLGAYDALSGTLIGMMPLAAFLSSIPYSMWTNRSFRHPFIMSCCLLIVGNITYSLADRFNRIWMALLGRFICGLGAPKCIIRRYMADTTPMSLRTSVNAGFGMVVAAGSAMGPAMAVILNKIDYTWHAPYFGFLFFNGLTLPGWFMAYLWTTFFIIVLATFEEPDRQGLKEQKERESNMAAQNNASVPYTPSNVDDAHTVVSFGDHDELRTIFSGEDIDPVPTHTRLRHPWFAWWHRIRNYLELITFPVRICLLLLFAKVFTIEALVSATSALTKNRYKWNVQQVGTLGFTNGILVIPFSILIGRLSMFYQDHVLMRGLVAAGATGLFLLIDISDLTLKGKALNKYYNAGHRLAVGPRRYILGYFLSYLSIQAFEGVIGSTLSKVIPTALASGTLNSGLLATLVDTFGRACGDLFISAMGYLNLRQIMNLLFIPTFTIMLTCLIVIERYRDLLSV